MKTLIRALALWACMGTPAFAQVGMGVLPWGGGVSAPAGGCSQATTFLARTSGLSGTESSAYTTLICGLVTDTYSGGGSLWSHLDGLWIAMTNNTTTFALNLVSTSFTAAGSGSFTFTPDTGISPDVTGLGTALYDTGLVPSTLSGNYTLNNGGIFYYQLNNRTTAAPGSVLSADDGTNAASYQPNSVFGSPPNSFFDINDLNFASTTNVTTQGVYVISRTASNALTVYRNGNTTPIGSSTGGSVALPTAHLVLMNDTTTSTRAPEGDTFAAFGIGAGFTSTDQFKLACRLNAMATTFGVNTYTNAGC